MRRDYMTGPTAFAIFADAVFNVLRGLLGLVAIAMFAFGVACFGLFAFVTLSDNPPFTAVPNPAWMVPSR